MLNGISKYGIFSSGCIIDIIMTYASKPEYLRQFFITRRKMYFGSIFWSWYTFCNNGLNLLSQLSFKATLLIPVTILSNQLHRLRLFFTFTIKIRRKLSTISWNLRSTSKLNMLGRVWLDCVLEIIINYIPVNSHGLFISDRAKRTVIQWQIFQVLLIPLEFFRSKYT